MYSIIPNWDHVSFVIEETLPEAELLLCWPCHHKEKRENSGGYSRRIEFAIEAWEARLERHAKRELVAREALPASHYS